MHKTPRIQLILVILISLLVGYYGGVNKINFDWNNYKPKLSVASKEPPSQFSSVDFANFWKVWQKIESDYYDKTKLDPQKMLNGAISGMVQSLDDPFTVYLPPVQNDNFKQGMAGQFQGIGAELGIKDQKIIVISPLNGSPSQKAGVRAGDVILGVNGQSTVGMTLSQAVEKIRGPKGTTVTLSISPKGNSEPKDFKITRDVITVKSVDSWIKKVKDIDTIKSDNKAAAESKIAYISLSQFGDNTNEEWLALINDLNLKLVNDKEVKGVILDLRNNPGGYLTDAVFISSEFIEEGLAVVHEEEATGKTTLKANRRGLLTEIPVKVLINKGSASASEIVAGALRDHERAQLIGETSFGKGTIQQAEDLGGGAGLHVTIAKWLTPNETWVNGKGLTPDILVEFDPKQPERDLQLEKAVQELVK